MPELIWTRSEDGLQLEGLAWDPAAGPGRGVAVVLIHGLASRFYSHSVANVAAGLAARGWPALSGNTRGHDWGSLVSRPDGSLALHGAAFEDPAEAPLDLAAWVGAAAERFGTARVVLAGHSLGGWKVAFYQAERHDPRVAGLALLSPAFRATPPWWRSDLVPEARAMAGDDLLPQRLGWIGRISARGFLARSPERGLPDLPELVGRAGRPAFASYGTAADVGGPRELAALGPAVETRLLEGADHNYTGRWDELAGLLAAWLDGAVGAA
jgi:pimeloyl-ACP methyl ester carboxylesterase